MPEALRKINWIDFNETDFPIAFADLIQTVELDREHAATHILTQQRANEWNEQNQSPVFLLNATACVNIEKWLTEAYDTKIKNIYEKPEEIKCKKTPSPTALQMNYIKTSREKLDAATALERKKRNRLKIIVVVAMVAAVIAIGLFVFALFQTNEAKKQKEIAENQKEIVKIEKDKAIKEKQISDSLKIQAELLLFQLQNKDIEIIKAEYKNLINLSF